ncbi:hypothetical protein HOD75_00210 [archaeon]|jgi:hypothetical protein|nr:hypothetical protein [archaeon]MBT4241300.1 hypothetical protein [archaeon]MBT4418122.1 hypothetical protein [archaeon]
MLNGKDAMGCVVGGIFSFGVLGLGLVGGYFGRPYLENIRSYLSARESVEVKRELIIEGDGEGLERLEGIAIEEFRYQIGNDYFLFWGTYGGVEYQAGFYPIEEVEVNDESVNGSGGLGDVVGSVVNGEGIGNGNGKSEDYEGIEGNGEEDDKVVEKKNKKRVMGYVKVVKD